MVIKRVDLRKIRSAEIKLRQRKVEFFMSLYSQKLGKIMRNNVSFFKMRVNGFNVAEISEGCHRNRALLELGVKSVDMNFEGEERGCASKILLKNVPLLNEKKYRRWFEGKFGVVIPSWRE